MLLGLNLSHDASVATTKNDGEVIFSLAEERISRVKNHVGIPLEAMQSVLKSPSDAVTKVIIGSHQNLKIPDLKMMLAAMMKNPSSPIGSFQSPYPSFSIDKNSYSSDAKKLLETFLLDSFPEVLKTAEFVWEKHHDSHLGCAVGSSFKEDTLLFSLDGDGDGESGAISVGNRSGIKKSLARFSQLDSLGHLYSAITQRYNFKPNRHEGKITGLAAFGKKSAAVDVLLRYVEVHSGHPKLKYAKSKTLKMYSELLEIFGNKNYVPRYLLTIAELAEEKSPDYPDLAWAIQEVLENAIIEIVHYWTKKTGIFDLSLTGGVFANVKLNQKLAELPEINRVNVFPNMGDGGIALGGVWSHLGKRGELSPNPLYQDMYLSPEHEMVNYSLQDYKDFDIRSINQTEAIKIIVQRLCQKDLVAIHVGRMEFGPRALGNRSLLIDPRDGEINRSVNQRLKRTEFMPFAPMVAEERFSTYFVSENGTLEPFKYMTMTCNVREEYRDLIPAITHVDGTARPQIVSRSSNPICHQILLEFEKLTGLAVLVNTSLNVHEEPINYSIRDSLEALRRGAMDYIYTGTELIKVRKSVD